MLACRQGRKAMHNPYLAILAAAVAAWVFGSVWYNVLA